LSHEGKIAGGLFGQPVAKILGNPGRQTLQRAEWSLEVMGGDIGEILQILVRALQRPLGATRSASDRPV
jgi:hypothetical protein